MRWIRIKEGESESIVFIKMLVLRYFGDKIGTSAAALTYYLLFSFFPFLLFLSNLVGFLDLSGSSVMNALGTILPSNVIVLLEGFWENMGAMRSIQGIVFSFFFTAYFPIRAVDRLLRAVNGIYRIPKTRPQLFHYIVVCCYTLLLMFSIFSALFLVVAGKRILTLLSEYFIISDGFIRMWNYSRFLILGIILWIALAALYRLAAGRKIRIQYILPGALAALISWLTLSLIFSYYVENLGNYSVIYGSISAIIVLLLWLYFSSVTILMGAVWNHVLLSMEKGVYFHE